MSMTTAAEQAPKPRFGVLRTIALYKLVKVVLLLAVAYGELRLARCLARGEAAVLGPGAALWSGAPRRHSVAGVVQRSERCRESMRCAS